MKKSLKYSLLVSLFLLPPVHATEMASININSDSNLTPVYLFEDVSCAKCHKHLNDESEGYVFEFDETANITYLCNECADKMVQRYEEMKKEFFGGAE